MKDRRVTLMVLKGLDRRGYSFECGCGKLHMVVVRLTKSRNLTVRVIKDYVAQVVGRERRK